MQPDFLRKLTRHLVQVQNHILLRSFVEELHAMLKLVGRTPILLHLILTYDLYTARRGAVLQVLKAAVKPDVYGVELDVSRSVTHLRGDDARALLGSVRAQHGGMMDVY